MADIEVITKRFEQFRQARLRYETAWIENALFYKGDQWLQYDEARGKLTDLTQKEQYGKFLHFFVRSNRIMHDTQRIVAYLMRVPPYIEVIPRTDDLEDIEEATVQTAVVDYVLQRNNFDDVRQRKWLTTYVLYGCAALMVAPVHKGIIGYLQLDNKTVKPVRELDIGIEILTPFEFWVDPSIDEWHKHTEVFVGRIFPIEFAKSIDPDIEPTHVEITPQELIWGIKRAKDVVLMVEHYKKPTSWQKGSYTLFVPGQKIIRHTDWMLPHDELPVIWGTYFHAPENAYGGGGPVNTSKGLQKMLNLLYSIMVENLLLFGQGRILAPRGSINEELMSDIGSILFYEPAIGNPTFVQGMGLPASFHDILNRVSYEYDLNMQIAEVLRGETPATDPAKKVQLKTIQAQEVFVPATAGLEFMLKQAGKQIIWLAKEIYSEKKKIALLSRDQKPLVYNLDTSKWGSDVNIIVKVGAQLPVSRQVMNSLQLEDAIMRYRANPLDMEAQRIIAYYYKLAGVPFQSRLFLQDIQLQKWELEQMLKGKDVEVYDFHMHAVHLAVLYEFMKTPKFYELAEKKNGDVIQNIIRNHEIKHREMMLAQGGSLEQVALIQQLVGKEQSAGK